jgi:predicted membrane-bound spermidine synthase
MQSVGTRRVFFGVALVSLGVLMLQLALTRLFSATMSYHFAFLAISLALFGSGAAGVVAYLGRRRLEAVATERALSVGALAFAGTTVLALLVVLGQPLGYGESGVLTLARLTLIYVAAALPFFCAGGVVTLALTRFAADVSRLYLYDLGGAAAGCLLLVPLLDLVGAVNAVLAVAVLAALAALSFEWDRPAPGLYRDYALVASALAVGLLLGNVWTGFIDVRQAKGLVEAGHVIFARWNSFSRVTVWGDPADDTLLVMIDADAATPLSRAGHDTERHAARRARIESLAYHVRPGGKTLVIGAGGGDDVILARLFGSHDVTAVEINPLIAREVMRREPFRSFSGALYEQPGVRLVVDEARGYLRRTDETYDVIQATMVDTWAATAAGAFALAENNLYTVEAFHDYVARLSDDGVLSLTRWYTEPPDQILRLATLTRALAGERGLLDAARHVMIVRAASDPGGVRAATTFLFKKSPFTPDEVARVEALAAAQGFTLLFTPATRPPGPLTDLLTAPDPAPVWNALDSNVAPTRDDAPFFFNSVRPRHALRALHAPAEWAKTNLGTFVLLALLALSTLLSLLFILGPLLVARRGALRGDTRVKLLGLGYFACLGAGFILVEVVLVQKCILFLGPPVYALAVVLFSLLAWSAAGSGLSGRIPDAALGRALPRVLLGVVGAVVLAVIALSPAFDALARLSLPLRIAVTVTLLAPLGLTMGMPMPSGLRLLRHATPEIISWAWGVNGALSVMGSVGALALALVLGFNVALLVGAGLYLAALLLARGLARAATVAVARS